MEGALMESVQLYPWRRDVQPPGGETTILSAKADQLARDVPQNGGELWVIRTLSETGVESWLIGPAPHTENMRYY